jgi:hypothetical protein
MKWSRIQPESALRIHATLAIALMFQLTGGMKAKAKDPHLGIIEYEISCMPCHGINGHGDGRLAKSLKTAPADLTKIAKSNRGKFSSDKVAYSKRFTSPGRYCHQRYMRSTAFMLASVTRPEDKRH